MLQATSPPEPGADPGVSASPIYHASQWRFCALSAVAREAARHRLVDLAQQAAQRALAIHHPRAHCAHGSRADGAR